jgi:hypothetical protein
MSSSRMLCRVILQRTEVSWERIASIIRVTKLGKLGRTLALTRNRSTQLRFVQEPHGVTSQKMAFFIVFTSIHDGPLPSSRACNSLFYFFLRLKWPDREDDHRRPSNSIHSNTLSRCGVQTNEQFPPNRTQHGRCTVRLNHPNCSLCRSQGSATSRISHAMVTLRPRAQYLISDVPA